MTNKIYETGRMKQIQYVHELTNIYINIIPSGRNVAVLLDWVLKILKYRTLL